MRDYSSISSDDEMHGERVYKSEAWRRTIIRLSLVIMASSSRTSRPQLSLKRQHDGKTDAMEKKKINNIKEEPKSPIVVDDDVTQPIPLVVNTDDDTQPIPVVVNRDTEYCKLHLGNELYVVAKDFRGKILVHIREYQKNSAGKTYPTKRGLAIDLEKWKKITDWHTDTIDNAIQDYKDGKPVDVMVHLGRNIYLSLKSGYSLIHVRRWFLPEDAENVMPTRAGITLTFEQWGKLKDCALFMQEILGDELDAVEFCELSESHQAQEGYFRCTSCNPNGTCI